MKKYLEEILYILDDDVKKIPALVLLFLGVSMLDLAGLGLVGPYIALLFDPQASNGVLGILIDTFGLPNDQNLLVNIFGLGLLTIFFLKAISAIWIHYKIIRFSQEMQITLRSFLMHAYQSLPYIEYLRRNSSEFIYCIQNLVGHFSGRIVISGLRTLSDGIVSIAIIILLAFENIQVLALLVVILGCFVIAYDRIFRIKSRKYGERSNLAATAMLQGVQEGIEGIKDIRILGRETYFYSKVKKEATKYAQLSSKIQVISIAPRYVLELLIFGLVILFVISSRQLGMDMNTLLPTLGMFGIAGLRLLPAASVLSNSLSQLRFGRDAVSRLYNDLKTLENYELQPLNSLKNISEPFKTLSLDRVSFCYPNAKHSVLKNVSFEINSGESIGLIGPSGSGKTTLVDLLLGLLEISEGKLLYNNRMLKEQMDDWRSQLAYLPQQIFIIDNTLRRNVALGVVDEDIDDERLSTALSQAHLSELVEQLPLGVDTILGERGIRFSGGQLQRVALARAFYHNRNVLVMDEATSSVDNETEKEIIEEIRKLKGSKTVIIIAHRLATVQHCDRIYRIENGRAVETILPD
jgi:ATP-binding cassette, subfamily B, bacterial PglK